MQFAFGPGAAWKIDNSVPPTPISFGVCQGISVDLAANNKDLYGQGVLPVTVGRGQIKVSGKIQFAQFNGRQIADFFGSSMVTGQILLAQNEAHTIPATSTYTVTTTNGATQTTDLGVQYAATGIPMTRVTSDPTVGQYTVVPSTGVYTFAAADEGVAVNISYLWTTTGGDTITVVNANQGLASTFKAVMNMPYNSEQANFTLNACVDKSLKFATKQQEFNITDYEFDAFCDSSNTLGTISVAELS